MQVSVRELRWRWIAGLAVASILAGAVTALTLIPRRATGSAPAGPPETVVEGFVRELAAHQFDRALPYLSGHLLAQTIPLTLEVRTEGLEQRMGRLSGVRGVPKWSVGTRAYAVAEFMTEKAGPHSLGFGLVLEADGAWRIDELYELGWKPAGVGQ